MDGLTLKASSAGMRGFHRRFGSHEHGSMSQRAPCRKKMRSPAPQWRATELISRRIALRNSIGKSAAHMISEIA
jgi:hypothetical protein